VLVSHGLFTEYFQHWLIMPPFHVRPCPSLNGSLGKGSRCTLLITHTHILYIQKYSLLSSNDPRHSIWHIFWHSIWPSVWQTYILTFYLAIFLAFYLPYILNSDPAFFLACVRFRASPDSAKARHKRLERDCSTWVEELAEGGREEWRKEGGREVSRTFVM
jgi:hypothetical protein